KKRKACTFRQVQDEGGCFRDTGADNLRPELGEGRIKNTICVHLLLCASAPLRLCGESCLPRPTEAGRHAVDREQQGHEVFACVAAGGAGPDAAEELDLLAAGAVQHGQAAVEAAAVVGEPVEQRLLSGEAQEVEDGAAVFGLDQGEDVVAQVGV